MDTMWPLIVSDAVDKIRHLAGNLISFDPNHLVVSGLSVDNDTGLLSPEDIGDRLMEVCDGVQEAYPRAVHPKPKR